VLLFSACSYCTGFSFLVYFAYFNTLVYAEQLFSLHLTDKDSVDCKDILEKFMLIRGCIIEENYDFCCMEGEYKLKVN
jgi:hypothetical protein